MALLVRSSFERRSRASSDEAATLGTSLYPHGEEPRCLRGVSNHEAACDWSSADMRLPARWEKRDQNQVTGAGLNNVRSL
jgi:hypothetical protein